MTMRLVAGVLLLGLAACGSPDVTVAETEDGKVTRSADGTYKASNKDGATMEASTSADSATAAAAAKALPDFAPLYPGGKVLSSMTLDDGKGSTGNVVTIETADDFQKVLAFYDGKLAGSGMDSKMRVDQPGMAIRGVGTENDMGTMISINDAGDMRTISITHGAKKID